MYITHHLFVLLYFDNYMSRNPNTRKKKGHSERPNAHLEVFPTLVTQQEQQIRDWAAVQSKQQRRSNAIPNNNYQLDEEDQEINVSVEELKKSNAQKMSILVGQLLAKNKINMKNAFEVPLIHLNQTCAFTQTSNDNSWKRLSSTLQSNNKIYGYRVDATHSYTYRVLESISRQEKKQGEAQHQQNQQKREREREVSSGNSQFATGEVEDCYGRYLEKNYRNINIQHIQAFFNVNPVLEKTKRIFDQNGLRGLLLNNLDLSLDLSLRLTLAHPNSPNSTNNQQGREGEEVEMVSFQGCSIFQKIQVLCVVNDLIEELDEDRLLRRKVGEIDELWGLFEAESQKKARKRTVNVQQPKPTAQICQQNMQTAVQNASIPLSQPSPIETISINVIAQQPSAVISQPQSNQLFSQIVEQTPIGLNLNPQQIHQSPPLFQSSQQPSHQSSSLPEPNTTKNIHQSKLISSYVKINKTNHLTEIASAPLHQGQEHAQQYNLVQKWKNPIKVQKRVRIKRAKPIDANIDFMDLSGRMRLQDRNVLLNIDKGKKKQFKKILKHLRIAPYNQYNCQINISQRLSNSHFQCKTLLSKYELSKNLSQQQVPLNDSINKASENEAVANSLDLSKYYKTSSIRQAKDLIQKYIQRSQQRQMSFSEIYRDFSKMEGYSPALCFLTVLHLANQVGYNLIQDGGDYNFHIEKR